MLCESPQSASVRQDEDLAGILFFHLRHARSRGIAPKAPRHFIVFTYDDNTLTILRVLHDSMDVHAHFSGDET